MRKLLDTAQGVGGTELGLENDFRFQGGRATALSGNAEFFFKVAADMRDGFDGQRILHSKNSIAYLKIFVKRAARAWKARKYVV